MRRFSSQWLNRHVNDPYVKGAYDNDLRSRSAFKFVEMNEKYRLVRPHDFVIDLGAAPGGWSLACSKVLVEEKGGYLVAVDLLPIEPIAPHCEIICGNFYSAAVRRQLKALGGRKPDVVLSDMLMNTMGHRNTDHVRSIELCHAALDFAVENLIHGGIFLGKFLQGADEKELRVAAENRFSKVKLVKPNASRSESSEIYLLAMGMNLNKNTLKY